ncbi:Myb-like DNA-binding domain containing protein [Tritrichomonas foetus]|uniref:Myb-like DNA-binding domain containing protein n=1 Tax=Tritrichomonas foetus TaxID=1144522 RepID=A0A1J4JPE6_9EUKA|nr:Myb-like DNA-binding domain containing protein [Tritrichomonas foetus]|eukprot:OHT01031.1 Myb-like DNA-binding domain containing protein [Tritrichomonas foetus]
MMFNGVSARGFSAAGIVAQIPREFAFCFRRNTLKIKFTPEEDNHLLALVEKYGAKDWASISQKMQTRNARQCRERWNNYVNPALRTEPWTHEEDDLLESKYFEYGARWNKISKFFTNRSDNNIRNRWMMIYRRKTKDTPSPISPPSPIQGFQQSSVSSEVKLVPLVEKQPVSSSLDFFMIPDGDQNEIFNNYNDQSFECEDWMQFF